MGTIRLSCGCESDDFGISAEWDEEICDHYGFHNALVYGVLCEEHYKLLNARPWQESKKLELEVFCDEGYFHMWCVKPKEVRDFSRTLHFGTEAEAKYVMKQIESWLK
jgi:hypothetical protein